MKPHPISCPSTCAFVGVVSPPVGHGLRLREAIGARHRGNVDVYLRKCLRAALSPVLLDKGPQVDRLGKRAFEGFWLARSIDCGESLYS